ncbi:MAG: linear amide C-N hydrolase [Crocosphaera sp.]
MIKRLTKTIAGVLAASTIATMPVQACTGLTLKAADGSVVFGRTMEWGTFELNSRVVIVPRGYEYKSRVGDGVTGIVWKTVYGAVGLDVLGKDHIQDGMNEKGLTVNVFYHPGFAEYAKLDPNKSASSIEALDVAQYLLTTSATIEDVKKAMAAVSVVGLLEPAIGIAPPIHLIVTEPTGRAVVIEFTKGVTTFHEAPLGVITNAPNYDWHMTNLRNYLNLSAVSLPDKEIEDLNFQPLGAGSGMIGLPGDFTPPSRFVRAVAFSKTARPTDTGSETMYEMFRILDNFNLPLGAAEGDGITDTEGMRSSTIWTTAYDTKNLILQYHTQHNRRIRQMDLKEIDFETPEQLMYLPLDKEKEQDIEDVTPKV